MFLKERKKKERKKNANEVKGLFNFTRMVVHGQLVEPIVCLSDLYDVFLLDIVRDTRQNLWTMTYRSQ